MDNKLRLPSTTFVAETSLSLDTDGDVKIRTGSSDVSYICKEHIEEVIKYLQGLVKPDEKPTTGPVHVVEGSPLFKVKVIRNDYTGEYDELSSLNALNIDVGTVFQAKLTNVGTYHVQSDQSAYGFALYLHPNEVAVLEITHE